MHLLLRPQAKTSVVLDRYTFHTQLCLSQTTFNKQALKLFTNPVPVK